MHGPALEQELDDVVQVFQAVAPPAEVRPSLILRVQLHPGAVVDEITWERCGLTLLSVEADKTLILFSSDEQLAEFRRRLTEYQAGPGDQKHPPHAGIFASIDQIGVVRPEDRIGRACRTRGMVATTDFEPANQYTLDVELWDFGNQRANREKVAEIENFIRDRGGATPDQYVGESLVLLRVRAAGAVIRELLDLDAVAQVDFPPQPTFSVGEMLTRGVRDFPPIAEPNDGSPSIAILDSGLTAAHPLLALAIGEASAIPQALGDGADAHGHGTLVAGIALYGDVEACIQAGVFMPRLRLFSVRVLNEHCKFDDAALITTQMREAINYVSTTYGCRIFNLSLGDDSLPYAGGKVSPWASILDTLARELNIVIVAPAGNFTYQVGPNEFADAHCQKYPQYLLDDQARIIEPATGAIVLTVGALSHSANLPIGGGAQDVALRPISRVGEPSPFTRSGPGLGDSVKPELCDFGGNSAYDGRLGRVRNFNELSLVSMNREYLQHLFAADSGTSFAAPRVAHVGARLLETFPDASANLIRALLASSATVPAASSDRLAGVARDAVLRVCGYGVPNLERAQTSDENRVVLFNDNSIGHDRFHIYQIPIPESFFERKELRSIDVTLAYDPPVRHSRFDYLGATMTFALIRGKTLEEVAEACGAQAGRDDPADRLTSTVWECGMEPGHRAREGGTLQKAVFEMKQIPRALYGDTYHLVVRCERKWARDEHSPQRYAIVVVMRQQAHVDIYNEIRQRIRARARVR
ncbi:MAG: S8 family peptidase [Candidatus Acidiferrales bacterium]